MDYAPWPIKELRLSGSWFLFLTERAKGCCLWILKPDPEPSHHAFQDALSQDTSMSILQFLTSLACHRSLRWTMRLGPSRS